MYIHDGDMASMRAQWNTGTERKLFQDLHDMLAQHNPFIEVFKTAHEWLFDTPVGEHDVQCRIALQGDPRCGRA
jgi:hypothetical protein